MTDVDTKSERREERKRNRRKMRVSGRGLKRLVQELGRRAKEKALPKQGT